MDTCADQCAAEHCGIVLLHSLRSSDFPDHASKVYQLCVCKSVYVVSVLYNRDNTVVTMLLVHQRMDNWLAIAGFLVRNRVGLPYWDYQCAKLIKCNMSFVDGCTEER